MQPSNKNSILSLHEVQVNLQKHNIPTLVPPHPAGKYEYFGSNPLLAYKYGCDENSTCGIPQVKKGFQNFLKQCIDNGFKLLYTNTI
jgi:hypothetical protein